MPRRWHVKSPRSNAWLHKRPTSCVALHTSGMPQRPLQGRPMREWHERDGVPPVGGALRRPRRARPQGRPCRRSPSRGGRPQRFAGERMNHSPLTSVRPGSSAPMPAARTLGRVVDRTHRARPKVSHVLALSVWCHGMVWGWCPVPRARSSGERRRKRRRVRRAVSLPCLGT